MNTVIFDLDETIYEEAEFVRSGHTVVAKYIETKTSLNFNEIIAYMKEGFKLHERESLFDKTLLHFNVFSKSLVKECLSVYRKQDPLIKCYPDFIKFMKIDKKHKHYVVTDGNKLVQKRKIKALGIEKIMDGIYITNQYGLKNIKPSPYCFLKIAKKVACKPNQMVYIGDNPNKDFIGIKPYGFHTVRMLRGRYKGIKLSSNHEAQYVIKSFNELPNLLNKIGI